MNVSKDLKRFMLLAVIVVAAGALTMVGPPVVRKAGGEEGAALLKENLDLPYDAMGEAGEEEDAPELIAFYGGIYEADGFFFCLDRSLSMGDGEWQTLKAELIRSVREFSERVQFGITFFSRDVTVFPAGKQPAAATPANKQAAISMVEGLQPANWTCLLEGLRVALEMGSRSATPRWAIILMSDGKPTCPGTDFVTYRQQILTEAATLNPKRMPIHAIAIGSDVDESFLRKIADQSRGTYRRIER